MPRFQVRGGGALLTITIDGEKQLAAFIPGIAKKIDDLSPIWDEYDAILRGHVRGRFDSQGGQRKPWPPLAQSTIIAKRKARYPVAPLIRTRALITALTQPGGRHILVKSKKYMDFGESEGYGMYHQSPLEPRRKLPRRAFFFIGPSETTKMIGVLRRHVEK